MSPAIRITGFARVHTAQQSKTNFQKESTIDSLDCTHENALVRRQPHEYTTVSLVHRSHNPYELDPNPRRNPNRRGMQHPQHSRTGSRLSTFKSTPQESISTLWPVGGPSHATMATARQAQAAERSEVIAAQRQAAGGAPLACCDVVNDAMGCHDLCLPSRVLVPG